MPRRTVSAATSVPGIPADPATSSATPRTTVPPAALAKHTAASARLASVSLSLVDGVLKSRDELSLERAETNQRTRRRATSSSPDTFAPHLIEYLSVGCAKVPQG